MLEMMWQLEHRVLDREQVVGPLLEEVCAVAGFRAHRYDMNARDQWRPFDAQRVVVDALTQRTQLLRIMSDDGVSMAMIAMGKHGEQPVVHMQLVGEAGASAAPVSLAGQWRELFERVPVRMASISSLEWREALSEAGIMASSQAYHLGMVHAWHRAGRPAAIEQICALVGACASMEQFDVGEHLGLVLASVPRILSPQHAQTLRMLHQVL
ncbi:MAG: hypothetical protein H0U74_03115 [Bradymonadaceae bacterium]|nr:hypothetical protein [Lujinxingiaceae bacterium]